jgi:2-keto-4-pentenoate hydratase
MTTERVQEAARLLVEAYRSNQQIVGLPRSCIPQDTAEAHAVQDAIAELRGPVKGWKVGQGAVPQVAPVFIVEPSATTLEAAKLPGLGSEIEFGFRLTRDLPPRGTPYTKDEVFAALEFLPLFELLSSRYIDRKSRSQPESLADSLTNGAFITGKAIKDWRGFDFVNHKATLAINGKVVQTAEGSLKKSNPPDNIVWLANHVTGRQGGLRSGQVITTGALAGTTPTKAGDKVVGDFGDWGKIEVSFR